MSAEDELKAFKLQTLKRARVTAVVLGLSAVIAVLFMIYGFTQSIEAQKQRDLSEYAVVVCAKEKLEYKTRAEAAEKLAIREAEYARSLAEELEQLKSGKKSKK